MAVLCSSCAGRLIFNPASQKLECANCGSAYRPEDVADANADVHSKYYDTRVYTCGHCGAEVITSDTESSTFCVYCGNPAIVFSRVSREYRPDGLIPFKITKQEAIDKINKSFLKNPIVPKEIQGKCVPENIRGIYVPYWVINADYTEADWLVGEVRCGKSTVTRFFSRAGEAAFKNVPVDGSKILNDDVSRKLEPFYLEDSKAFDEDYLNGFYSNTSDMDFDDLKKSAAYRCHKLFSDEVAKKVRADKVKFLDSVYWIDIHDDPIYMMFPVWFFTFKYEDKPYTVLVNGQTGKLVGTMPWQKKRIGIIAGVTFVLVLAVIAGFFATVMRGWDHSLPKMMHAVIVAILLTCSGVAFTTGTKGLRKIFTHLTQTRSEDIFKFVKKRQG